MGLAALIASCSDDDRNNDTDNQHLVSPSMAVSISNTDGRQSPFTGILTIMPCDANSFIYYGNYVKGKLSPFYGYYRVKEGSLPCLSPHGGIRYDGHYYSPPCIAAFDAAGQILEE